MALPFAICTLIWGSTWFVIGSQLHYAPGIWSIAWRFLFGTVAMFVVAVATRAELRIGRRGHWLALVIGIAQFALNYIFVYAAEAHIASGLVALISALMIVPNALLARVYLGQSVSRRFVLGSGIAMAGIGLLFADELWHEGGGNARRVMIGVALTLAGLMAASMANVLQATRRAAGIAPASLVAWSMLYGALINLGFALATSWPPRLPLAGVYLAGLLYLAIMGSAVTFTQYARLLRTIGPARTGYVGVLVPVIAMALSTLFEGYRWTAVAAGGAALAVAGLVVAMRARSPAR